MKKRIQTLLSLILLDISVITRSLILCALFLALGGGSVLVSISPYIILGCNWALFLGAHFAEKSLFLNFANILAVFNISKPVNEKGVEVEPEISWSSGVVMFVLALSARIWFRYEIDLCIQASQSVQMPDQASFEGTALPHWVFWRGMKQFGEKILDDLCAFSFDCFALTFYMEAKVLIWFQRLAPSVENPIWVSRILLHITYFVLRMYYWIPIATYRDAFVVDKDNPTTRSYPCAHD